MHFSIATVFGLAALAAAQSTAQSANATSAASEVSTATSTSLSPQATCLAACGTADICCQAKCVGVPCPSDSQANATTECAARCPQGNGTQSETEQYASCQASCVSSYFLPTGTGAAAATGSGSNTAVFGATSTGAGSGTRTGSSASSTASSTGSSSNGAAHEVRFGAAGAGLIGLIIAGLAL